MGFKVHHPGGYDSFGDEDSYAFNDAGLLVIRIGDGGGQLTYSPHAWSVVEEPGKDDVYLKSERFRLPR
jgi:hypothetical protein